MAPTSLLAVAVGALEGVRARVGSQKGPSRVRAMNKREAKGKARASPRWAAVPIYRAVKVVLGTLGQPRGDSEKRKRAHTVGSTESIITWAVVKEARRRKGI